MKFNRQVWPVIMSLMGICCPDQQLSYVFLWMCMFVMSKIKGAESSAHHWHRNIILSVVLIARYYHTYTGRGPLCAMSAWSCQTVKGASEKTLNIVFVIEHCNTHPPACWPCCTYFLRLPFAHGINSILLIWLDSKPADFHSWGHIGRTLPDPGFFTLATC